MPKCKENSSCSRKLFREFMSMVFPGKVFIHKYSEELNTLSPLYILFTKFERVQVKKPFPG